MLVFEAGGSGNNYPQKRVHMYSFSRVEVTVVVVVLARSNHPRKRAGVARFQGWWCWQGATAFKNERVCSFSRVVMVVVVAQSHCPRKRANGLVFEAGVVGGGERVVAWVSIVYGFLC